MLRRFGAEAGVLDVADDLDLVHAVGRAGRPHDVLLDHHRPHVVGAEEQAQLPHLAALRDPRRLEVVEVVEDQPGDRQGPQVVDASRLERDAVLEPKLGVIGLETPRDERGEPAGLVLQVAQPQHVFETLLERLDRAVHHRRGRAQSGPMRLAHHAEPLVGGRLAVAVQQLAHAIDENLGAAAGNAVEAGGDEPLDHGGHRELGHAGDVQHLGRRQRVQLEGRVAGLHRAKEVFVPSDRQVRVVPALQQQLTAADADGLVDLLEDLVEAQDVAVGRADGPVERAEVAPRHADVRVVDVAVDDVGDDAVGMPARARGVGQLPEHLGRRAGVQGERVLPRESLSGMRPIDGRLQHRHQVYHRSGCTPATTPTSAASAKKRSSPACSRAPMRNRMFSRRYVAPIAALSGSSG